MRQQSYKLPGRQTVPALNLSAVKFGKDVPVAVLPEITQETSEAVAIKDAELSLDDISCRQIQLHPDAPVHDRRCFVYQAVDTQELTGLKNLLDRLPQREACEVLAIWDALLKARRNCEMMAARGVRISRDISKDWQETVSDLIDRVVLQDKELVQLRFQVQAAKQLSSMATSSGLTLANLAGVEELQLQIVRLKRQRDKLVQDQQDVNQMLLATQQSLKLTQQQAISSQDQLVRVATKASALKEQHAVLLHQHIELAAYAERLEALVLQSMAAGSCQVVDPPVTAQPDARSPVFTPPANHNASIGRRSPMCGLSSSHSNTTQPCDPEDDLDQPPAASHVSSFTGKKALAGVPSLSQALAAVLGESRRPPKSSSPQGNIPSTRGGTSHGLQRLNGAGVQKNSDAADGGRSSSPGGSGGRKAPRGATGNNVRLAAHAAPARSSLALLPVRMDNGGSPDTAARTAEGSDHSPDTNKESLAPDDQHDNLSFDMLHPAAVPGRGTGFAGRQQGSKVQHNGIMQYVSPSGSEAKGAAVPEMAVTGLDWQCSLRDLMEATQQQLNAIVSEGV
eukprot:gene5223-5460_t